MKEKLVIIGAGGQGKVCTEIAKLNGYKEIVTLDDNPSMPFVFGETELFTEFISDSDFFVAIGDNHIRKAFIERIIKKNGTLATLIHPNAVISPNAEIECGTVVMAGAVINTGASVGIGSIVNTGSSVDHDCRLDDYCHTCVGSHLAGTVHIGEEVLIGAGAIVINNITVADETIVGAGATVLSNITEKGTYVGTPARRIK